MDQAARLPRVLRRRVRIGNPRGLHARSAARFVKLAATYDADVTVSNRSGSVSGTSIMGLMSLGAGFGSEVDLAARGPEAAEVMGALCRFLEDDMDTEDRAR